MTETRLNAIIVLVSTAVGIWALSWWLFSNPVKEFTIHNPGMDNRPDVISSRSSAVNIGARFSAYDGAPSSIPGEWPRFRGAEMDNISKEDIKLADSWGDSGPDILWSIDLGEGHAGPVISNGRIYILDYDEEKRADILRCFSFDDGREIWQRGYNIYIKRNHGVSRTLPAVMDQLVVTIGPKCHVMCVDAINGDFKWGIDLVHEYEAEVPLWYTGQCPLIDESVAVIAVGGRSLMIGVDCHTGEVLWKTSNPNNLKMSHSSVIPCVIHGHKMYLYCAIGAFVGVSAEKETQGQILFESSLWDRNVIAPSPLHIGEGRIFVTAGYGGGSMMLKISQTGTAFTVDSVQSFKPGEGAASEQQTPVLINGHLFTILPKDGGIMRNQFVCYHPDDCSTPVWASGKQNRFGLGPYLVADGKFYILSDEGVLTMARVSTKAYTLLGQSKILDGHDAWGPLAIVNGRMLARDSRRLVCVDLRAVK